MELCISIEIKYHLSIDKTIPRLFRNVILCNYITLQCITFIVAHICLYNIVEYVKVHTILKNK